MYYDILDTKMNRKYKKGAKNQRGLKYEYQNYAQEDDNSDSDDNKHEPLFKIEKDPNAVMKSNALKNVKPS